MNIIWITWENHRRTRELAEAIPGVRLYELTFNAGRIYRYTSLLLRSLFTLNRERPDILIVQNPSIVLALFATTVGKLFAGKIIVDAHNEGLTPFYGKHHFLLPLYRLVQKNADMTIVTNQFLSEGVTRNGGRPFILEDRVPTFKNPQKVDLQGKYNCVLISTFEKDEPYEEVIVAAAFLNPEINIYITGNHNKVDPSIRSGSPPNVIFTGFLSEEDYADLLFSCDAVIDLTLIQDCLVCGAYEALAFGKPMILSDNRALRAYFSKGAVYTGHQPVNIAAAIQKAIDHLGELASASGALKETRVAEWQHKLVQLLLTISRLTI